MLYLRQRHGLTVDLSGSNVNRHCLVSYDPRLYRNGQAVLFDWQAYQKVEGEKQEEEREEDSSLNSLRSLPSPGSLTLDTSGESEGIEVPGFLDSGPVEQAFTEKHRDLAGLYQQLLAKRQRPKRRERNQCVVGIVTFLVRAVGEGPAMLMVGHWYDLHAPGRFNDTRAQHLEEAKAHWCNVLRRYPDGLSAVERAWYAEIPNDGLAAAFRICRDLALSDGDEPPPVFHLSWKQLSVRLGF